MSPTRLQSLYQVSLPARSPSARKQRTRHPRWPLSKLPRQPPPSLCPFHPLPPRFRPRTPTRSPRIPRFQERPLPTTDMFLLLSMKDLKVQRQYFPLLPEFPVRSPDPALVRVFPDMNKIRLKTSAKPPKECSFFA